jgi:ParB-like chromosome segregation protein Spo0J
MEIIDIELKKLKQYNKNPRLNEEAVEFVANSIKDFGFKVPIVVDENFIIIAGHTRYLASKKLGLETVPCVIASDLSEEQAKAFRLADNKVAEASMWDFKTLAEELEAIGEDLTIYGFSADELDIIKNLQDEGLKKNGETDDSLFTISFAVPLEEKNTFDEFMEDNDKKDLNAIFLEVIMEEANNEDN